MTVILLIEDNDLIRRDVAEILELEQFDVIVADSGDKGLSLAQERLPDLILSDVHLPGLDGYGVFRAVTSHPATQKIPFVFISGIDDVRQIEIQTQIGRGRIISKPFRCEHLLKTIQDALHGMSV